LDGKYASSSNNNNSRRSSKGSGVINQNVTLDAYRPSSIEDNTNHTSGGTAFSSFQRNSQWAGRGDVMILHRSPIKVWYKNETNAMKERAEIGLSNAENMKCQLNDRVPRYCCGGVVVLWWLWWFVCWLVGWCGWCGWCG